MAIGDTDRAALIEEDAQGLRVEEQGEVRAVQRRMQVAPGGRLAPAVPGHDLVNADTLTLWTVEILSRKPQRTAAADEVFAQRVNVRRDVADVEERTVARCRAPGSRALLEALKVRQHVTEAPPGIAERAPLIEVARQPAVIDERVDGSGAAQHFAARPE